MANGTNRETKNLGIASLILDACENVCNRALKYDTSSRQRIALLDGKILHVATYLPTPLGNIDFPFYLHCTQDGVIFTSLFGKKADAVIEASSLQIFIDLIQNQGNTREEKVNIHGDKDFADELKNILSNVDIDWEEPLSQITGDVVAHEIGSLARKAGSWLMGRATNFKDDLNDYVSEEQDGMVMGEEFEVFTDNITQAEKESVELEAKIKHLQEQTQNLGKS